MRLGFNQLGLIFESCALPISALELLSGSLSRIKSHAYTKISRSQRRVQVIYLRCQQKFQNILPIAFTCTQVHIDTIRLTLFAYRVYHTKNSISFKSVYHSCALKRSCIHCIGWNFDSLLTNISILYNPSVLMTPDMHKPHVRICVAPPTPSIWTLCWAQNLRFSAHCI